MTNGICRKDLRVSLEEFFNSQIPVNFERNKNFSTEVN